MKKILKIILRILIPVAFFSFVFHVIKIQDLLMAFHRVNWTWFGVGTLCIVVVYYLCALRTRDLITEKEQPLTRLFHIHALSSLISGFLPFLTGELSYVYYLRKYCTTPTAEGMAILVSVRFLEYIIFLLFIFLLAVIGIYIAPTEFNLAVLAVIGVNLILVMIVVWNASILYRFFNFLSKTGLGFFLNKSKADSIHEKMEAFSSGVKRLLSMKTPARPVMLTVAIVLLRQAFVLAMLKGMDVSIGLWLVVFLFAFLYVTRFVQGIGSFGNHEAGIAAALMLTGFSQIEAFPIAIGTHLLQWAPILVFGCIAYLAVRFL